jgi:hypothetical protein
MRRRGSGERRRASPRRSGVDAEWKKEVGIEVGWQCSWLRRRRSQREACKQAKRRGIWRWIFEKRRRGGRRLSSLYRYWTRSQPSSGLWRLSQALK